MNSLCIVCVDADPAALEELAAVRVLVVGDADGLVQNVNKLWDDPIAVMKLGTAGQEKVVNEYIPELYYEKLMAVYAAAISETAGQRQSKVQEYS